MAGPADYAALTPDREEQHLDHPSHRPLSQGYEDVGIAGEFAFGEFSGLWPDTELKPGGDDGIDFTVALAFTVDVKTARKPYNLIHEEGKPFADIFVLAEYVECGKAKLLGWEWGEVLREAPVRDFGYGVMNHYIPAGKLRSMASLAGRLHGPASRKYWG